MHPFEIAFKKKLDPDFLTVLENIFPDSLDLEGNFFLDGTREVPFVKGVPRFVSGGDNYVKSFSKQWGIFSETQLDSSSGSQLTLNDLVTKTQIQPNAFNRKVVLDVGVGIGRHAEYFCKSGAFVIGVDLSSSIEQANENLKSWPNFVALQADLFNLPLRHNTFDLVYSIGVLHHTPSWQSALESIGNYVKQSGLLSVWLYGQQFSRRDEWIPYTSRFDHNNFLDFCALLSSAHRNHGLVFSDGVSLYDLFRVHFPFSVHHETFERTLLALFDGYSPAYHAVTTSNEISLQMEKMGFTSKPGVIQASAVAKKNQATILQKM